MAELKKFVGTVLTFPDVAIPGVTLTIVGLTVLSDPTNAADPCTQPDRFASYRFRLHAVVRNVSASKVIVFNANVRCGLFGQDPVYDSGPNAKLGTLSFNLAFEDIHEGEYGLSLPFTGSPFDLNGVTFPEAGASFFVPHAIIDRCRVLINV